MYKNKNVLQNKGIPVNSVRLVALNHEPIIANLSLRPALFSSVLCCCRADFSEILLLPGGFRAQFWLEQGPSLQSFSGLVFSSFPRLYLVKWAGLRSRKLGFVVFWCSCVCVCVFFLQLRLLLLLGLLLHHQRVGRLFFQIRDEVADLTAALDRNINKMVRTRINETKSRTSSELIESGLGKAYRFE